MADETEEEDLDLAPEDAGLAFRTEMWATNFLMGNWKGLIAILVVGLLLILGYGQWQAHLQRVQRGIAARIAEAERELPPVGMAALPELVQSGEADDLTPEKLSEIAAKLDAIGDAGTGTGAVEAWLKAAEMYRLAENQDLQRASLEKAATHAKGVLDYAAQAALANLELEQDQGDAAVERFRGLMDRHEGMLAEQAALDLGLTLEHLERSGEAAQVYDDFLTRWPESTRIDEVSTRRSRLGANP